MSEHSESKASAHQNMQDMMGGQDHVSRAGNKADGSSNPFTIP